MTDGLCPAADEVAGLRRARAATAADAGPARFVVPLPGRGTRSARGRRPAARSRCRTRSGFGRSTPRRAATAAGCRCPGPSTGHSYGFGDGPAHLPQPAGFSRTAVAAQSGTPESTLELYREALRVRRQLQTAEALEWVPTDNPQVLHFVRPGGWHCITNFGTDPVPLPEGVVRVSQRAARRRHAAGRDGRLAHGVAAALNGQAGAAPASIEPRPAGVVARTVLRMPLFGRKKTDEPAAIAGRASARSRRPRSPTATACARWSAHQEYLLSCVEELPPFRQHILDALDLAICEDISSPINLPRFDNTAMDGYAVRAAGRGRGQCGRAGQPAGGGGDRGRSVGAAPAVARAPR